MLEIILSNNMKSKDIFKEMIGKTGGFFYSNLELIRKNLEVFVKDAVEELDKGFTENIYKLRPNIHPHLKKYGGTTPLVDSGALSKTMGYRKDLEEVHYNGNKIPTHFHIRYKIGLDPTMANQLHYSGKTYYDLLYMMEYGFYDRAGNFVNGRPIIGKFIDSQKRKLKRGEYKLFI